MTYGEEHCSPRVRDFTVSSASMALFMCATFVEVFLFQGVLDKGFHCLHTFQSVHFLSNLNTIGTEDILISEVSSFQEV